MDKIITETEYTPFLRIVETIHILDNGQRIGFKEFEKSKSKFSQVNHLEIQEQIVRLEDLIDRTTKSVVTIFQDGTYNVYNYLKIDFNAMKQEFPEMDNRDIPKL